MNPNQPCARHRSNTMPPIMLLKPLLCLWIAATLIVPAAAMSLEEAGVALGNEDFKVREAAEKVIRMADIGEYDRIARLSRSDNPEVAARCRRSLPIVLLGIDNRFPPDLATKLRRIDDFSGRELERIVEALTSMDPPRLVTLIGLHSHWQVRRPAARQAAGKLVAALEIGVQTALRGEGSLTDLSRLNPDRYETKTLSMVLNVFCKQCPGDLSAVLPLHESWTRCHPQLMAQLNADGYRLEVAKASSQTPQRSEGLRKILHLATQRELTNDQKAAVRKQLSSYRDEALVFPVATLDRDTGWYFFDVFGSDQGGHVYLDAYRKFRARFPDMPEKSLLAQPLEVLLVLDKSGPGAAMNYAMTQSIHGGVMLLGEWLHAHPELIREPLPLPPVKNGKAYNYRTIKFFRIFAPYADDAEMRRNPEITAAFEVLAKDPGWIEVAKQARAAMAQQK